MSFAAGWDPALGTYFAEVMDYSISRDDGCVIGWLRAMPPHYTGIDTLVDHIRWYSVSGQ
jgi:hypothetical protein